MSLKITNTGGFVIGGVSNPSQTEIYVRCNVDMSKQETVLNNETQAIEFIAIDTIAKTTIEGGLFDKYVQIEGILPEYWLRYSPNVTDMNEQYLEIETDLKTRLEESQPDWTIEIVSVPTV